MAPAPGQTKISLWRGDAVIQVNLPTQLVTDDSDTILLTELTLAINGKRGKGEKESTSSMSINTCNWKLKQLQHSLNHVTSGRNTLLFLEKKSRRSMTSSCRINRIPFLIDLVYWNSHAAKKWKHQTREIWNMATTTTSMRLKARIIAIQEQSGN